MTNVLCINSYSCFHEMHFEKGKFYQMKERYNGRGILLQDVFYRYDDTEQWCVIFDKLTTQNGHKNFYYYFKEFKLGR